MQSIANTLAPHTLIKFAIVAAICASPAMLLATDTAAPSSAQSNQAPSDAGDLARKAEILHSPEWRRAIFELGMWLDSQQIYSAGEVALVKSRFNARVQRMTSYELQYLLNDLNAKLHVINTPEAIEARSWAGQYLSALSDAKRAELLKDVPDITEMSAAQLAEQIRTIERERAAVIKQQSTYESTRQQVLASQQQSVAATQRASISAQRGTGSSLSPYRGPANGGKSPFSDVKTGGGVHVSVGPFGAYVSF